MGYYINKTYDFGQDELTGRGFNNTIISGKFRILTDYVNRFYIAGSLGAKIPLSCIFTITPDKLFHP